jgi:hypothetical protein
MLREHQVKRTRRGRVMTFGALHRCSMAAGRPLTEEDRRTTRFAFASEVTGVLAMASESWRPGSPGEGVAFLGLAPARPPG